MAMQQLVSPRTPAARKRPSSPPPLFPLSLLHTIDSEANLTFKLMSGKNFPLSHKPRTVADARAMILLEVKKQRGDFNINFFTREEDEKVEQIRVDLAYEDGQMMQDADFVFEDMDITIIVVREEEKKSSLHQEWWGTAAGRV